MVEDGGQDALGFMRNRSNVTWILIGQLVDASLDRERRRHVG